MSRNEGIIKTCSILGSCHYKMYKTVPECTYEGYCDWQLPHDSRTKEINPDADLDFPDYDEE